MDCGPSNPLKSLQRQFETDRSHQLSRPGRVSTTHATSEQDAFLSARREELPQLQHPLHVPHAQHSQHIQTQHVQAQHGQTGNLWTTEFSQGKSGWGAEFMAQRSEPQMHSSAMNYPAQMNYRPQGYQAIQPLIHQPLPAQSQSHSQTESPLSDTAFSEAFKSVDRELSRTTLDNAPDLAFYNQISEMPVVEETTRENMDRKIEGDGLADVAGDLIDSLHAETSTKFRNSKFMALMHSLRDRDVVVENNEMVRKRDGSRIESHISSDVSSAAATTAAERTDDEELRAP